MDKDYLQINRPEELQPLCERLRQHDWFTLDTEFIRERTYLPQLCLIQVANPDLVACIDPIAIEQLDPLGELLYDERITKVLHAADQDVEIFYHLFGKVPAPLFDSQIAATFLGQGEQTGYGNLVKAVVGIDLPKGHSRTNWQQRPLDKEQLEYAADDVRYLRNLYESQLSLLEKLGRKEWFEEEMAQFVASVLPTPPLSEAWRRVKGNRGLKGVAPSILQDLAAWREDRARQRNKPRRWIVKDEVLLELSRQQPVNYDVIKRMRGIDNSLVERYGGELINIIKGAKKRPQGEWLIPENKPSIPVKLEPIFELTMAVIRERCRQNQLSPGVVTQRSEVGRLISGERDLPLLQGWRGDLIGNELAKLLDGELQLSISDGHLVIAEI